MKAENSVLRQIDGLLAEIGEKTAAVGRLKAAMEAAIARAAAEFEPTIKHTEEDLKAIEAELIGMAKFNKAALFTSTDRVDLKHGALIRQVQRKVKRIKGMLERLKAEGMTDAVKVAESVDWDRVEQWDDEILKQLGTKRTAKEIFAFEMAR